MAKALVKLAFRHEIGPAFSGSFEKDVFLDSYNEFRLQAQAYNREGVHTTLEELIASNPKANSLHYKVGFAVGLYISALKNQIPGIKDLIPGSSHPSFESHEFEIIHSNLSDRNAHRVAVTFYTGILTLLETVGDQVLLANGDLSQLPAGEWMSTFMIRPSTLVTVHQYQSLPATCTSPHPDLAQFA
ncbi:hypothetical protein LZZ85_07590 [Terrimonas sp. NA20]|uniref:Uncharacterized protein n=1 Tax=Terrimonas ginsenosidimutans TaxID=2908004 RepID=A0ABS9KP85_9BACT|nr:hypothetical protein [Terrimonas ginsenosidimutans]MCG2614138.1 hypothetical protein [Terrimonas ginsenosidimutans]